MGSRPQPRIVHADVVALDQLLVYNRFGSFNPYGMIFALRRDVQPLGADGDPTPDAKPCGERDGTAESVSLLEPGNVRIRDCKRPRPLVLRANAGDILEVTVTNLLRNPEGTPPRGPDISHDWCGKPQADSGTPPTRADVRAAFNGQCTSDGTGPDPADWPATRRLSFVIPGLEPVTSGTAPIHPACLGLASVPPGTSFTCRWRLEREGTHLFSSLAAPAGGEGDGGSLVNGLFGALLIEPSGSDYLRSQVSQAAFDAVWARRPVDPADPAAIQGVDDTKPGFVRHARSTAVALMASSPHPLPKSPSPAVFPCDAKAVADTVPVLRMTRDCEPLTVDGTTYRRAEIVHGDLNAIIMPPAGLPLPAHREASDEDERMRRFLDEDARKPFREFTVVFHDELKTFYADEFKALDEFGQFSGIRDGFAINYGASGLGAMVVANRKKIGPAANCPECQYEEFFLESWANGDPALLEAFPDDPSNVHHSYLNDKVVFRNLHAGPKETHVFHLHTHQWFAGNDQNRGSYLDSQTIGPQQGFTYRIYQGGHDRHQPPAPAAPDASHDAARGWWETAQGSGNRNRTPGDAIFHCHLYPHFAQGMWELWRVHDALEDGTRVLPDGQNSSGLSLKPPGSPRRGSVDPQTGAWLGGGTANGTPIPGLIPIPSEAVPTLPTYFTGSDVAQANGMPGYPFYIAGKPGHRTPQPPLDMAFDKDKDALLDGGLPRHVVTGGTAVPSVLTKAELSSSTPPNPDTLVARSLALGDITTEYESLALQILPHEGTRLERNAMGFHHDGLRRELSSTSSAVTPVAVDVRDATGATVSAQNSGSYASVSLPVPSGGSLVPGGWFSVNGAPPAPGAPFADPCGAASGLKGTEYRRFRPIGSGGTDEGKFDLKPFGEFADDLITGDPWLGTVSQKVPDPGLTGFRRYDVSAVQIDMTVNRAGWHDPQARIAMLTSESDGWKRNNGLLRKTARAEPFFFRAFSGECVELRHTNELPKDLDLDDFQLRVPTDTIGQHIHLVKFDVTSSDGSGNGWNYEDGTFAADEILARICAARAAGGTVTGGGPRQQVKDRATECHDLEEARAKYRDAVASGNVVEIKAAQDGLRQAQLWWKKRGETDYFQTTVQRWFADPILSNTGDGKAADRTLRTVFSHDHFAPSNIQQHGYYTALLIEPQASSFCVQGAVETDEAGRCVKRPPAGAPEANVGHVAASGASVTDVHTASPWQDDGGAPPFQRADSRHVGSRATVFGNTGDMLSKDRREFALAIADFALLYDGAPQTERRFDADASASSLGDERFKGLARLVGEVRCGSSGVPHEPDLEGNEQVPAQAAGLCARSTPAAANAGQVTAVQQHAIRVRLANGRPVAPPIRPEAISQQHHDPYLVNYRNEPAPLRLGSLDREGGAPLPFAVNPCVMKDDDEASRPNRVNHRRIRYRREDGLEDVSMLFRTVHGASTTNSHGDPCTPVLDMMRDDRVQFRLIQGAQEVQHLFTVEGRPMRRNPDQNFPAAIAGPAAQIFGKDVRSRCFETSLAYGWQPRMYEQRLSDPSPSADWDKIKHALARCDNVEGFVTAQEIGISEHFEFAGQFRLSAFVPAARIVNTRGLGPTQMQLRRSMTNEPASASSSSTVRLTLPPDSITVRPHTADYLFHFGSQDALWNGAWGLIRTTEDDPETIEAGIDPNRDDLTTCLASIEDATGQRPDPMACLALYGKPAMPSLGDRLPPLNTSKEAKADPAKATYLCDNNTAKKVILYATRPAKGALTYNYLSPLSDPDPLILVPMPETIAGELFSTTEIGRVFAVDAAKDPAFASTMTKLENEAQKRFAGRPEPVRVNAGQCLQIAIINGWADSPMADHRGDAPMPHIVPLNVERNHAGPDPNSLSRDSSYHVPDVASRDQVRPSRYLALSVPLSGLDQLSAIPAPYGLNATGALAPGQAVVETYYAGRVAFPPDTPDADHPMEVKGVPIPYAFGALPVRSVADPFGHVSHGLFGMIIVEPEGTTVKTAINLPPLGGGGDAQEKARRRAVDQGTVLKIPGDPERKTMVAVREHLLVLQDGLNLYGPHALPNGAETHGKDAAKPQFAGGSDAGKGGPRTQPPGLGFPLPNCRVCDDSYDYGEKGVSYGTAPFTRRLAGVPNVPPDLGLYNPSIYPRNDAELNRYTFPSNFFTEAYQEIPTPILHADRNEEVMVRLMHPGGRARQRALTLLGANYDDMFPGFGSGHAGLLAPGKAWTAGFCAPRVPNDYLWRDGPQQIFAGGAWGMLRVQSRTDHADTCSSDR